MSPPAANAADAAVRRAGAGRLGLYAVGLVVGVALLSAAVNAFVPSQHGPPSSSYATTPGGLAAYAELLARSGHPVDQLRRPPAPGLLSPATTVVLLEPDAVLGSEGRALANFVARGGRLVAGGSGADAFLATIVRRPPRWTASAPDRAAPLASVPETAGVSTVTTLGQGGWSPSAGSGVGDPGDRPVLGLPGRPPLLLVRTVGPGRVLLLADASPLQNRLLASGDNARLAVNLAGAAGRPVVFVESVHGYGAARGLAALPGRWWWSAGGLMLAGLALVASRWRRLGPPSARGRRLPPARSAYLQAMTTILRRTDAPGEMAGLARTAGRRLVARRIGMTPDVGGERYAEGSRRLGLTDEQARALAGEGPAAEADLLVIGAAVARLQAARPLERKTPGR